MRTPMRAILAAAIAVAVLAGCEDAGERQLIDEAENPVTETVGDIGTDPDLQPGPGGDGTETDQ